MLLPPIALPARANDSREPSGVYFNGLLGELELPPETDSRIAACSEPAWP